MSLSLLAQPNRSAFLGEKLSEDVTLILIQFDASISERYTRRKEVTNHPVESGSDVSDQARTLPTEITIRGWVSDDPIIVLKSLRATPSVSGGNPDTRALDAWRELNRIMDEESTVKVVSDLDAFDDMVLQSIDVTRDKDSGRILDATISLKQIVIAKTEVRSVPTPAPASGQTASNRAPKSTLGKKVAKPTNTGVGLQIFRAVRGG